MTRAFEPAEDVVLLCTDARYLLPCAFVLDQLAADPDRDGYDVVVIHDGVPEPDLRRLIERSRRPFTTIPFTAGSTSASVAAAGGRLGAATYMRLHLDALLPAHYRRVLYLDCDLYLEQPPITRLLGVDLGGMPFAAARDGLDVALLGPEVKSDIPDTWRPHEEVIGYKRGLGLGPHDPYINAGVLLIDRRKWSAERLSERVLAFTAAHPQLCEQADQSALNAVKGDRWAELSPRWNYQPVHIVAALAKSMRPYVHHFAGPYKPWNSRIWGRRFTQAYHSWRADAGWHGDFPPGPSLAAERLARAAPGLLERLRRTLGAQARQSAPISPELLAAVRRAVVEAMVGHRFVDLDDAETRAMIDAVAMPSEDSLGGT